MTPQDVIDVARDAVWITLLLSSPPLLAGLLVGLVIGLLQAMTQIQEQTISFVPKIVAMILAVTFALPWLISQMVEYSSNLIAGIPGRF